MDMEKGDKGSEEDKDEEIKILKQKLKEEEQKRKEEEQKRKEEEQKRKILEKELEKQKQKKDSHKAQYLRNSLLVFGGVEKVEFETLLTNFKSTTDKDQRLSEYVKKFVDLQLSSFKINFEDDSLVDKKTLDFVLKKYVGGEEVNGISFLNLGFFDKTPLDKSFYFLDKDAKWIQNFSFFTEQSKPHCKHVVNASGVGKSYLLKRFSVFGENCFPIWINCASGYGRRPEEHTEIWKRCRIEMDKCVGTPLEITTKVTLLIYDVVICYLLYFHLCLEIHPKITPVEFVLLCTNSRGNILGEIFTFFRSNYSKNKTRRNFIPKILEKIKIKNSEITFRIFFDEEQELLKGFQYLSFFNDNKYVRALSLARSVFDNLCELEFVKSWYGSGTNLSVNDLVEVLGSPILGPNRNDIINNKLLLIKFKSWGMSRFEKILKKLGLLIGESLKGKLPKMLVNLRKKVFFMSVENIYSEKLMEIDAPKSEIDFEKISVEMFFQILRESFPKTIKEIDPVLIKYCEMFLHINLGEKTFNLVVEDTNISDFEHHFFPLESVEGYNRTYNIRENFAEHYILRMAVKYIEEFTPPLKKLLKGKFGDNNFLIPEKRYKKEKFSLFDFRVMFFTKIFRFIENKENDNLKVTELLKKCGLIFPFISKLRNVNSGIVEYFDSTTEEPHFNTLELEFVETFRFIFTKKSLAVNPLQFGPSAVFYDEKARIFCSFENNNDLEETWRYLNWKKFLPSLTNVKLKFIYFRNKGESEFKEKVILGKNVEWYNINVKDFGKEGDFLKKMLEKYQKMFGDDEKSPKEHKRLIFTDKMETEVFFKGSQVIKETKNFKEAKREFAILVDEDIAESEHFVRLNKLRVIKDEGEDKYILTFPHISQTSKEYFEKPNFANVDEKWGTLVEKVPFLLSGYKFLHDRKILHWDIKEENILIDEKLQFRIIDFGSSFRFGGDEKLDKVNFPNSIYYQSPELIYFRKSGKEKANFAFCVRCELWAIIITFYKLTFNKNPVDEFMQSILSLNLKNDKKQFEEVKFENGKFSLKGGREKDEKRKKVFLDCSNIKINLRHSKKIHVIAIENVGDDQYLFETSLSNVLYSKDKSQVFEFVLYLLWYREVRDVFISKVLLKIKHAMKTGPFKDIAKRVFGFGFVKDNKSNNHDIEDYFQNLIEILKS